ncbi:MAG: Ig-like domain-containing protein [Pseudomonadota bacterium]
MAHSTSPGAGVPEQEATAFLREISRRVGFALLLALAPMVVVTAASLAYHYQQAANVRYIIAFKELKIGVGLLEMTLLEARDTEPGDNKPARTAFVELLTQYSAIRAADPDREETAGTDVAGEIRRLMIAYDIDPRAAAERLGLVGHAMPEAIADIWHTPLVTEPGRTRSVSLEDLVARLLLTAEPLVTGRNVSREGLAAFSGLLGPAERETISKIAKILVAETTANQRAPMVLALMVLASAILGTIGAALVGFRPLMGRIVSFNEALREETHRAQAAERAKSDFLATMSHEILAAGMAGRSITLSASDFGTDPEGEALVIDSVTQPANGSVAIAPDGSTLTYTPSASFAGLEVIDVALSEASSAGESRASATLSIDVEALAMPDFDFALHYTDGGQERIAALEDGMVLPLGALDDRPVSIVAETDATFDGSVRLTLGDASRIENHEPYALFGDMAGDLHGGMAMEAGSYEVTYAVFSGKDGEGALLGTGALGFAVEPPILEAALYTTASQMDAKVMALIDGSTIDASDLVGHGRLSIGFTATADAPEIGSVRLRYDGGEQVENVTPYALFGNIGDNFRGGTQFEPGLHEIDVAVFADRNAGGELLETFVFEFEVA